MKFKRKNKIHPNAKTSTWYIDSVNGNDGYHGTSWQNPLKSIDEFFRRLGDKPVDGHITPSIDVYLKGEFNKELSYLTFNFYGVNGTILNFRGTRKLLGVPLSPVTNTTHWDGPTNQEHTFTIPGVNWSQYINSFVQVIGGPRNGQVVSIASDLGSGIARSPGYFDITNYIDGEVQTGDILQPYSLTKINGTIDITIQGDGAVQFFDCDLGSSFAVTGGHSVYLYNSTGYEFANCIINGLDNMRGAWSFIYGCIVIGFHNYGWLSAVDATLFTSAGSQAFGLRGGSYTQIYSNNIFNNQGPYLGHRDGPGFLSISGPNAVCNYEIGVIVADGSQINLDTSGYLWLHDSSSSSVGYSVYSRSGIGYINAPAIVGVAPTYATSVGGLLSTGLVLPVYNVNNGAAIVADQ